MIAVNAAALISKLLHLGRRGLQGRCQPHADRTNFSERFDVLKRSSGTEQKVLVFAPFKARIKRIVAKLNEDRIETEAITGETSLNERNGMIFRFQNGPALRVLVIQPQAAAHGVTLTAADTVVWWGPASSVEYYKQANDRVHRIGQTHNVSVFHIISSGAEEKAFKRLQGKISTNDLILDLFHDIANE